MRVFITGGTGLIGKAIAERLVQHGFDVRVSDLAPAAEIAGAEYVQCDILNFADVVEKMRGCDAIVHLAAIRTPYMAPAPTVFDVNVTGTFNVYEAAAVLGIRRVVQASSINAIGLFYGTGDVRPQYFPIDEEHPPYTTDVYSFSKQMIEDIGDYFWRRDGISGVSMRFPGIYQAVGGREAYLKNREHLCRMIDDLMQKPEAERQAIIAQARQGAVAFRQTRPFDYPANAPDAWENLQREQSLMATIAVDAFNFWTACDLRDVAQSLERALTADYTGHHRLFINAAHNYLGYDSTTLARLFFPEVTQFKRALPGTTSLVSIDRARELIGFEPEYGIDHA